MVPNLRSTLGVIAIYNFSYKSEKTLWFSLVPQGRKKNQLLMYKNTKWPLTGTHVSQTMTSSLEKKNLDFQFLISCLIDVHVWADSQGGSNTQHISSLWRHNGRDFVFQRREQALWH